ncbi:MAG: protein-L-isoaspartate(D-aspartate) O-methyltransferase [Candidatus Nealsonbacteria bacterium]|nr:protein-L-isoaspartate(D-aspartate) O-methyltransferase [Candidatus Nealsonbacteria bacterium]
MSKADLQDDIGRMLDVQLRRRGIVDRRVLAAMAKVPREQFVLEGSRHEAYADRALGIDCGQTISQPYIVALMTQALELSGSEKVLEIGTGSGYQTAILAELAGEVISIERHAELAERASDVLSALGYENVTLTVGDGTLGCEGRAPFERIIVTAACAECPPALLAQLAEHGVLVAPLVGRDYQTLQAIRKVAGQLQSRDLSACRFVPLVGEHGWKE